jgi:spore coat polysaccharide biosynthesis protein SpsF
MTQHVIERVLRAKGIGRVVVAVPEEALRPQLIHAINQTPASHYIDYDGDPSDLIGRYTRCAEVYDFDIILRIPGDNPCVDPTEIERMLTTYNEDPAQWNWLTTNLDRDVYGNGYPGGLGCEIYDLRYLQWMNKHVTDPILREHPHRHAFTKGRVRTLKAPVDIRRGGLDFSVNTLQDFKFIEGIYEALYPSNPAFSIRDVLRYLDTKEVK